MNFSVGDKIIIFTKYGGVHKTEIKEIKNDIVIDTINMCSYSKFYFVTKENVKYYMEDVTSIGKIEKEYTKEESKRIISFVKQSAEKKKIMREKMKQRLEESIKKLKEEKNV